MVIGSTGQVPDFNFRQLGSEQGLNNPNIFSIGQHSNGVMYFTTQNGIYSYDGYTFDRLEIDSLQSNALETSVIGTENKVYLSVRGRGVALFDLHGATGAMRAVADVPDNNADQLLVNSDHAFLLTTRVRLFSVDLKSGKFSPDDLRAKDEENLPLCIFKTKDGRVLAGRTKGLYEFVDGKFQQLSILRGEAVYCLAEDRQGRLLVGMGGKIATIQDEKIIEEFTPVYRSGSTTFQVGGEKSITHILSDDFGRIWFTSFPGDNLYLYEFGNVYDIFEVLGIQPSLINCLFLGDRQNVWVGTMGDGVYQIQNTFFRSFNFSFDDKILNVNRVFLEGDLLVAATSNGLFGLNVRTNQSRTLSQPDPVFLEPVYGIIEWDGAIYYTKRNEMNMSPSIFLDSKRAYRFRPVSARSLLPLNNGRSIAATWDGYIVLTSNDPQRHLDTLISFTDYRIAVNALLLHGNVLYVATNNGLFTYDFETRKQAHLVRSELNYNINDLAVVDGRLYAAHDGGITNISDGRLITSVGPFLLNSVRKVRENQEQVWVATLDGVYICDREFRPLKVLNKAAGLLSNTVNDFAFDQSRVAIATARGVSITDFKNIIRHSTRLRPVTIDYLLVDGRIVREPDRVFELSANAGEVSLFFLSPLFQKTNTQYFRYRENNGAWKHFENLSQISLAGISGGIHRYEIQASADNIQWSEPVVVKIEKKQKITETASLYWLLSIAVLLTAAVTTYLLVRRVKLRALRRLGQEQQVNLLKHQAMNALLSPHFIFNSLTSIQNYINTNNSLRASEYLAKFSRLIRMIIEKAGQSHISLHDELSRLTYYLELEKERFKNKFDYEIQIDPDINTHEVTIPNMIIQPYVENSILHGILPTHAHGVLQISFMKGGDSRLIITIEDNGIGLIKAAEHAKTGHKSLGTSTIRNILEVNSKLTGKKQKVQMTDKSTVDPDMNGTVIRIELEL